LLWIGTLEDHNIQASSAIVGPNLDWHHVANTRNFADYPIVILRQATGGGAKPVLLKDDQVPVRIESAGQAIQPFLDCAYHAKNKHRNG
jgi:hypothetical protein